MSRAASRAISVRNRYASKKLGKATRPGGDTVIVRTGLELSVISTRTIRDVEFGWLLAGRRFGRAPLPASSVLLGQPQAGPSPAADTVGWKRGHSGGRDDLVAERDEIAEGDLRCEEPPVRVGRTTRHHVEVRLPLLEERGDSFDARLGYAQAESGPV